MKACKPLQTSPVRWEYEDQLPEMEDSDFDEIYPASRVDGVRLYPYVEDSAGNRIWLTNLPNIPHEPPRKELQATHTKAASICKALDIAINELSCVASAPCCVVNPAYSKGAMKTLKKIEKLIK